MSNLMSDFIQKILKLNILKIMSLQAEQAKGVVLKLNQTLILIVSSKVLKLFVGASV